MRPVLSDRLDGKRASRTVDSPAESEARLLNLPDSRVRRIGTNLPAETIEGNPLDGIKIDALKTAGGDHVVGGIRSRTIEGSNAAVAAKVVKRAPGAELIRSKISLPFDEAEPIRGDHVVEVALAPADGTVAFADAGELGSNLELDPSAVAGASIELHFGVCEHRSSFAANHCRSV